MQSLYDLNAVSGIIYLAINSKLDKPFLSEQKPALNDIAFKTKLKSFPHDMQQKILTLQRIITELKNSSDSISTNYECIESEVESEFSTVPNLYSPHISYFPPYSKTTFDEIFGNYIISFPNYHRRLISKHLYFGSKNIKNFDTCPLDLMIKDIKINEFNFYINELANHYEFINNLNLPFHVIENVYNQIYNTINLVLQKKRPLGVAITFSEKKVQQILTEVKLYNDKVIEENNGNDNTSNNNLLISSVVKKNISSDSNFDSWFNFNNNFKFNCNNQSYYYFITVSLSGTLINHLPIELIAKETESQLIYNNNLTSSGENSKNGNINKGKNFKSININENLVLALRKYQNTNFQVFHHGNCNTNMHPLLIIGIINGWDLSLLIGYMKNLKIK